ncbi:MAG: hypothetical protein KDK96_08530, partial [Chlamydiia bacterium]|nr:hypothetical protein [Chlamydiia bacterium]
MASINNTTNSSTPLSQPAPVRTQASEQRTNVEPSFSHVIMPESSSLSNRCVEQLSSQSSSIPLSVPSFGDLRRSQEEEKAFTPARPVFFEDDLELPNAMPTIVDIPLPEVLPSAENFRNPPTVEEKRESTESKIESFSPARALPEMSFSNQDAIFTIAFGKAKWEKYFGDIGVEPPLPSNIEEVLNSPCPFWEGKKVKETHLLTLIPSTINGIPFNLDLMEQLIQNPSLKYKS